ncbi:MAG: LysR family transcriptional regulator, partial [Clostridiales bacterium]|nr:LysR family transcriptional regulator [Clostridiales bacterium]
MDISKLRSVCLVGKYRNYAEAAYHLCVSPSVLSKHISYVENELGVALFERANKSTPIKLTPVGEKILPCLNEMLDTYYKAVGIAKDYPESSENLLTVCTCPYIGDFHEPEMLSAFIREHPNTTIVRRVSSVRSIVEQICSGLADAAFLPVLNYIGSDDEYMPLANANISVDELFTIKSLKIGVGKSHPLAECTKITDTEFDLLHNDTFLFSLDQTDTRWPSKR